MVEPQTEPQPELASAPATAALPPAPVEVFKVKKVSVVSPDETTDMGPDEEAAADPIAAKAAEPTRLALADTSAGTEPTIDTLVAAHEAAISQETVIAKTSAPRPANFDKSQMAMLGARDAAPVAIAAPVTAAPVTVTAPVAQATDAKPQTAQKPATTGAIDPQRKPALKTTAAAAPQPVQRGLPPSTLQAQAATFAPAAVARPSREITAAAGAAGGYEIQIGAYDSVEEAQRNLAAVQGKAGRVLSGHPSVTEPASKAGKSIYRARFRGFTVDSANSACSALRGQSINCFVMAAD